MNNASLPHPALLLLGPTAAGKTPLGNLIERRGLWDRSCVHFDFGENLRRIVAENRPDEMIPQADVDFLRRILKTGGLLEDEHFPIAEGVLRRFLAARKVADHTLVVLNGLPRHVGQALAVDAIVRVEAVISLRCPAETVVARIHSNIGGDRTERTDDDLQAVRRKLETFRRRTTPLEAHYRDRGARIHPLDVSETMSPEDAWRRLGGACFPPGG